MFHVADINTNTLG